MSWLKIIGGSAVILLAMAAPARAEAPAGCIYIDAGSAPSKTTQRFFWHLQTMVEKWSGAKTRLYVLRDGKYHSLSSNYSDIHCDRKSSEWIASWRLEQIITSGPSTKLVGSFEYRTKYIFWPLKSDSEILSLTLNNNLKRCSHTPGKVAFLTANLLYYHRQRSKTGIQGLWRKMREELVRVASASDPCYGFSASEIYSYAKRIDKTIETR